MNKLFTKIAGAALGLTMAIGVGVAVGSSSKEATPVHAAGKDDWVQVTALSGLNTTDTYVIANDADKGYFMNGTVSSGHFQSTAFGASAPASASAAGAFNLVAVNATNNIYKIKLVSTSKYVKASKAGSGGGTVSDSSDSAGWKFLVSGTSFNAIYQTAYSSKYAAMRCYNNTSWRTYSNNSATSISTSSGTVFRLYKYQSATLSSISVKTAPTKTSYVQGEYFDPTGLVITRTYSDSSTSDYTYAGHTSDFTFSPTTSTALTTSHTSVTITYGGKTCNQAITVSAPKTPSSLSSTGQTTSFEAGETFTYGGTLTVTYTDSTGGTVSPGSFKIGSAGINPTSAGTVITPGTTILNRDDHHGKTVYVLYTENATTVYTSYTISVAAVSKVTFTGGTETGTAGGQGQSDSLTKSGVTMACDSCYTTSGAYRFYSGSTLTISSAVGNIAQIEFNMNGSYNSNLLSTSTGTYNSSNSSKGIWTGDASSVEFALSAQARCDSIVITLASTDPSVELDATSATSVSMLKGDSDTSVKVVVKNIDSLTWSFTFDEDEDEGLTTSSYISVSASALVSNVSTLTITTKAVGSTVMHISVSGTDCETTVPVSVAAKPVPGTMVAKLNSTVVSSAVECKNGGYVQFTFEAEDTDGNTYTIHAGDINASIVSGGSYGSLRGTTGVNGTAVGTVVARYELKVLSTVYVQVTVNVINDSKVEVNSITFNSNLADTQGDAVDTSAVFATKTANTHFGGDPVTIDDSEFLFSYENNRSGAESIGVFSYDFTHGSTVDATHKTQIVYVFVTFDDSYSGSFSITIEQKNDPLTAITLTNVTDNEVDVARGSTFQLEWAYTPTNPTDGKEVEFVIDDNDDGIDITVSPAGLISIGASSDLGTALVLIQSAHDDTIQDYVYVSAVLETMKYTVSETESLTPVSTVSSGDRVYMIGTATDHNNQTYEFNGYPGTYGGATEYTTSVAKLQLLVVEAGTESGTVAFKLSGGDNDGEYISYSGSSNTLNHTSTKDASASWTVNGSTITNANTTARQIWLNWNNGSPRFACYTNKTSTTGYYCPTFIKVTGGDTEYDVTETLFNGVHNNFGAGKTYEWDATCSSFDEDAWLDACVALTEITGYSTYKLNRAVGNMAGNEIEVFLAKYDAIVRKFGTSHDHLDRFSSGGINASIRIVNSLNIIKNNNTAIIVIVASAIGLAAVGGYFFLRKKER